MDTLDPSLEASWQRDITLDHKRMMVALEATIEIFKLCHILRTVCTPVYSDEGFAVLGLTARIEELGGIIFAAINDPDVSTDEIGFKLRRKQTGPESVATN